VGGRLRVPLGNLSGRAIPSHRPTEGTEETVQRTEAARSGGIPTRATTVLTRPSVSVVGDITPQQAAEKIKQSLLQTGRPKGPAHPFGIADVRGSTRALRKNAHVPGKSQADVVLGFPGLARSSPDYQAANVANMILGVLGLYGRLGDRSVMEQGLVYYVVSQIRAESALVRGPCGLG